MTRLFPLVLFTLLSMQVRSQTELPLDSCIRYAIGHNLQVRNAHISKESAAVARKSTAWSFAPSVYAGSNAGWSAGRSIDPTTNSVVETSFFSNSYYANATMELFDGFSRANELACQQYLKAAADGNVLGTEDEVAFNVMNAFYDVLYFRELVSIAQEQRAISALNLKKTETMVSTGQKAEADLLEVRANMERDELLLIQSQGKLKTAQLNLRRAMNAGPDFQFDIASPPQQNVQFVAETNADSLFNNFAGISPWVLALESEWRAGQKNVAVKRAGYFPSLRLEASFGTAFYETNRDLAGKTYLFGYQLKNNQNQYVGLSLSVPLFDRNQVRFSVKQARLQAETKHNQLLQAKQELQLAVAGTVNELEAASRELGQAQNQLRADEMAFEAAQKKYDRGMISVVDLYTAKNRLSTTKGQALRARLTLDIKQRTVDFYNGVRFWQFGK